MKNVLEQTLLEMTKETQQQSVEWCFLAVDATLKLYETLENKINEVQFERFPDDRNARNWSYWSIKKEIIENEIGTNVYNIGDSFISKGSSRNKNPEMIIKFVEKEFNRKRENLKNKINKLVEKSNSLIKIVEDVTVEKDGTLGVCVILENDDVIKIEVITAGGYNIQRFHFRGLCKLLKRS